jgi:hypothetical protein
MKVVHVRIYEEEDVDQVQDPAIELLYVDNKHIISGDYYHARIRDQINGFLACLRFIGIPFDFETRNINDNYDNWSNKKELS